MHEYTPQYTPCNDYLVLSLIKKKQPYIDQYADYVDIGHRSTSAAYVYCLQKNMDAKIKDDQHYISMRNLI
jgi:hypothetical protein